MNKIIVDKELYVAAKRKLYWLLEELDTCISACEENVNANEFRYPLEKAIELMEDSVCAVPFNQNKIEEHE